MRPLGHLAASGDEVVERLVPTAPLAEPTLITGLVVAFVGAAAAIPDGWTLCDGRTLTRGDPRYTALFEVLDPRLDGSAPSTFRLPDFREFRLIPGATFVHWLIKL